MLDSTFSVHEIFTFRAEIPQENVAMIVLSSSFSVSSQLSQNLAILVGDLELLQ
jgi:hypothetical protein